jgi:hypothetical protein
MLDDSLGSQKLGEGDIARIVHVEDDGTHVVAPLVLRCASDQLIPGPRQHGGRVAL